MTFKITSDSPHRFEQTSAFSSQELVVLRASKAIPANAGKPPTFPGMPRQWQVPDLPAEKEEDLKPTTEESNQALNEG